MRGRNEARDDLTSARAGASSREAWVTLTTLGLSLPKNFFIADSGGERVEGNVEDYGEAVCGPLDERGSAPPRGRRRLGARARAFL